MLPFHKASVSGSGFSAFRSPKIKQQENVKRRTNKKLKFNRDRKNEKNMGWLEF